MSFSAGLLRTRPSCLLLPPLESARHTAGFLLVGGAPSQAMGEGLERERGRRRADWLLFCSFLLKAPGKLLDSFSNLDLTMSIILQVDCSLTAVRLTIPYSHPPAFLCDLLINSARARILKSSLSCSFCSLGRGLIQGACQWGLACG